MGWQGSRESADRRFSAAGQRCGLRCGWPTKEERARMRLEGSAAPWLGRRLTVGRRAGGAEAAIGAALASAGRPGLPVFPRGTVRRFPGNHFPLSTKRMRPSTVQWASMGWRRGCCALS